ncbi:cold-shock protein [Phytohabitans kaempferiae]|uniref:Cold-shock protein n=1 Tax=Phytohabitans kaempferiae TaxID=1620943 RepID=A0ABV6MCT4_9ACTN
MVDGVVREWRPDEGWGIIDSPETPGGCWAHFSHIQMPGYRSLSEGDRVRFTWERGWQDGYSFRAVTVLAAPEK